MNSIFEKLRRSWLLFKHSVLVIRDHPKLLLFPIVTGVLTSGIVLFFLAPVGLLLAPHVIQSGILRTMADSLGFLSFQKGGSFNFAMRPAGAAILAGIYLVNMFLATMGKRGLHQSDHRGAGRAPGLDPERHRCSLQPLEISSALEFAGRDCWAYHSSH